MPIFHHIVQEIIHNNAPPVLHKQIPKDDFYLWKRQFTFDAMRGQRYGQSFCNHFNIRDFRLFYDGNPESCDKIIWQEYIQESNA